MSKPLVTLVGGPAPALRGLPAWVVVRVGADGADTRVGVRLSQLRYRLPSGVLHIPVGAVWCHPEDFERVAGVTLGSALSLGEAARVFGRMQFPPEFRRVLWRLYRESPVEVSSFASRWQAAVVEALGAE